MNGSSQVGNKASWPCWLYVAGIRRIGRQQGKKSEWRRETVLVTGAAGFIGMHVAQRLLADGYGVVGLDNLNAYYDPRLKEARLENLAAAGANFRFEKIDVADRKAMADLFAAHRFPYVVHLAAQAGVRHSLIDPHTYADANLTGFLNVLEGCRHNALPAPRLCIVLVGLRRQYPRAVSHLARMSTIRSASTAPPRRPTS